MNKFLVVIILALVACDADLDALIFQQFQKFINKYNKKYDSITEFLARYEIFKKNVLEISKVKREYKTGITKFSDLTKQEFAKYLNINTGAMSNINNKPHKVKAIKDVPESFDWRDQGVINPIKDQASCNSSWAFSIVDNLEGIYAINKGPLTMLSVQMIIDCDNFDDGCNGGLMENGFDWVVKNGGGIMTERDYPYEGTKGNCRINPMKYIDMTIVGYVKLVGEHSTSTSTPFNEDEVLEFLYEIGPLPTVINATPLKDYTGGIIDLSPSDCPESGINHYVTLVGYGSEDGKDYWIVRNCWGINWGEDGYFRIKRGEQTCGINTLIITATVDV